MAQDADGHTARAVVEAIETHRGNDGAQAQRGDGDGSPDPRVLRQIIHTLQLVELVCAPPPASPLPSSRTRPPRHPSFVPAPLLPTHPLSTQPLSLPAPKSGGLVCCDESDNMPASTCGWCGGAGPAPAREGGG